LEFQRDVTACNRIGFLDAAIDSGSLELIFCTDDFPTYKPKLPDAGFSSDNLPGAAKANLDTSRLWVLGV